MSDKTKIRLSIYDNMLFIDPWVPELWHFLHYKKKGKQKKWPFKYVSEDKFMYTTSINESTGNEVGLTYAGMYQHVLDGLKRLEYDYYMMDSRPPPPKADMSLCQDLRPLQDGALDALLNMKQGIIECPPGFGKTFLICQYARIVPNPRMLITTPRTSVVNGIMRRVSGATEEFNGFNVSLMNGSKKFSKKMSMSDVIVSTSKSLHKIPVDWADIIIYDECHGCATEQQIAVLERFEGCRMFGLSASPDGRLDGADMEVTGMFGPIVYRVTYQQALEAGLVCPIIVHMVDVDMRKIQLNKNTSDDKKQQIYYRRNERRNELIAQCARTFKDDEHVLILVKTAEHALFLRLLLPDFHVVHGGIDEERWKQFCDLGLVADTPEFRTSIKDLDMELMEEAFEEGRVKKVIATPKWREGVDFPTLSGLIRADGSSGSIDSIQIVGRLSRISPGKEYGTVYDFNDIFSSTTERKSKARRKHYETQQWTIDDNFVPPPLSG
jgi:superfamily II DNA or RNA helicase